MKIVKLTGEADFTLANKGELAELYSIEDVKAFPGISVDEYEDCERVAENPDNGVVGFMKEARFSDTKIIFIQVYDDEIEYVEDKVEVAECQHIYRFLRTDSFGNDIFYCEKCLEYKYKTKYN